MLRRGWISVGLLGLVACGHWPQLVSEPTTGPVTTLATVDGTAITNRDLEFLVEIGPAHLRARLETEAGRQQLLESLIERELFYAESRRQGLHRGPTIAAQLALYNRVIIAQAALTEALRRAAQAYYDQHPEEFLVRDLRHILITVREADAPTSAHGKSTTPGHGLTEALTLAQAIKARVTTGHEDFATVAQSVSEDQVTKAKGGDLGPVSRAEARLRRLGLEPLLEATFAAPADTLHGPIRTKQGLHLFLAGPTSTRPLTEVESQLNFRLQNQVRSELLESLKAKAQITYANPSPASPVP